MERMCLSLERGWFRANSFLLWEKQFHMQLTLVSHENISEAGPSFVIQNHPLYSGFLEAQ